MSCAVCFNLIVLSQLYHSCSLLLWKNILIESHFLSNHLSPALLIWRHSCLANKRLVTIAPPTPHIIPQACVVTTHNNHHAMLKQNNFRILVTKIIPCGLCFDLLCIAFARLARMFVGTICLMAKLNYSYILELRWHYCHTRLHLGFSA